MPEDLLLFAISTSEAARFDVSTSTKCPGLWPRTSAGAAGGLSGFEKRRFAEIPDEWTGVGKLPTPVRKPDGTYRVMENEVTLIKANAAYQLAARSKKPSAIAFTNWIYGEVVPSILKTGEYSVRRRARYEKQGKLGAWIEVPEEGIEARKDLLQIRAANHGVDSSAFSSPPLLLPWERE